MYIYTKKLLYNKTKYKLSMRSINTIKPKGPKFVNFDKKRKVIAHGLRPENGKFENEQSNIPSEASC